MFQCTIYGNPIPQKQTRFVLINGKPRCYDPSSRDNKSIQRELKFLYPEAPMSGPVELSIHFFMPIPTSTSLKKREKMLNFLILPDKKPDEDNLAYLITNALKKIVYNDDAQICVKHVYKLYGDTPRTVIKVRQLETVDPFENQ